MAQVSRTQRGSVTRAPTRHALWLQVADVQAVHDELCELGVEIDAPPEHKLRGEDGDKAVAAHDRS